MDNNIRKKNNSKSSKKNISIKMNISNETKKELLKNKVTKNAVNIIKITNKKTKQTKRIVITSILLFFVLLGYFLGLYFLKQQMLEEKEKQLLIRQQEKLNDIRNSYNQYVITNKDTKIYSYVKIYKEIGIISKNMQLELDIDNINTYQDVYFKLKNYDYYIYYKDVDKIDELVNNSKYPYYKNYIHFNENMVTNKVYIDDNIYYNINNIELPIIIKDDDLYYSEFDGKLVYVKKEDIINIKENINSTDAIASSIAVLNYHYIIASDGSEDKECTQSLCHTEDQFDRHMKYIKENSFYTPHMYELEMFLDNKINLPKKSVIVTLDDGWFVSRSIPILEKYNLTGTLFLIGSLLPANTYKSNNLEIHSHGWDIHKPNVCPGGRGGGIRCLEHDKLLEDLTKSRESLNNTTVFCYPFYDYTDYSIKMLKEAGFTMAFGGGDRKVTKFDDRFKLPRFRINNRTTVDTIANMIN